MSEGQTATNQQTGQRVVMRGGQWVPVGGPASAPAQTPQSRYVAPIVGEPDPYKQSAEARAQEDQARQQQLDAIRTQGDRFDLSQKQMQAGVPDAPGEAYKAAAFLRKGIDSLRMYQQQKVGPRSLTGTNFQENFPNAQNKMDDPNRQVAQAMQESFVKAILRPESGAVIGPEEMKGYLRDYFPIPGASPQEIEAKRQIRLSALNGLYDMATRALTPEARQEYRKKLDEIAAQDGGNQPFIEDQNAFNEALSERIKRGDSVGALVAFMTEQKRPPNPEQIDRLIANQGNKNPVVQSAEGVDVGRALGLGVGDIAEAAGDTLGIVANPLNAGINAVLGTNLGTDLGQAFRDATGLPAPINETEKLASAVNKGGASALGMAGLARTGARLATGATENALARFGAAPATDTIAGGTSGAGGEYARQKGAGPVGQVLASVAAGGASIPAVSAVTRRMGPAPVMNDLMQAGQAEGVSVNRAMVDKTVAPRVTGTQATLVGGRKINSEMGKISGQIEQGVQRLGNGGTSLRDAPSSAGKLVQDSAERFIKKSGKQARKIYDQAEAAAGDVKIQPQEAGQEIGSIITRLSETANTNSAEIAYLKGLEEDLGKGLSVGALRDLRTTLRQKISKGELTFGQNEARVLGIMDAISRDLENGLRSQGKEAAARLFSQADKSYRARMEFITGTVQKIIGKRNSNLSSEQVFSRFEAMARPRGDEAGLARMMRTMEPDEQADIAATFADALGKSSGKPFSTSTLVTQAEKLPEAARVNLFGQEGAASLNRLIKLANEHARVTGSFNNSRTGQANDYRSWLTNLLFGGGTTAIASVAGGGGLSGTAVSAAAGAAAVGGLKAGRDALSAKALMSTDLTKWLATAPATMSPKAINSHFDRLSAIAARQPALQADIRQLQQRIMGAANDFTGKAAASGPNASEQEANSRKAPGQE